MDKEDMRECQNDPPCGASHCIHCEIQRLDGRLRDQESLIARLIQNRENDGLAFEAKLIQETHEMNAKLQVKRARIAALEAQLAERTRERDEARKFRDELHEVGKVIQTERDQARTLARDWQAAYEHVCGIVGRLVERQARIEWNVDRVECRVSFTGASGLPRSTAWTWGGTLTALAEFMERTTPSK